MEDLLQFHGGGAGGFFAVPWGVPGGIVAGGGRFVRALSRE
jgi:hypothetical protein